MTVTFKPGFEGGKGASTFLAEEVASAEALRYSLSGMRAGQRTGRGRASGVRDVGTGVLIRGPCDETWNVKSVAR